MSDRTRNLEHRVRVWGDTAVVTALLWIKALQAGKPADHKLWFSDAYIRTPTGSRLALRVCRNRNRSKAQPTSGPPYGVIACWRSPNFPSRTDLTSSATKMPRKTSKRKSLRVH
jgi:hypothetical protein